MKKRRRDILQELLNKCTYDNRKMFCRMYPMGILRMNNTQVKRALEQTRLTVRENWEKSETYKLFQLNL